MANFAYQSMIRVAVASLMLALPVAQAAEGAAEAAGKCVALNPAHESSGADINNRASLQRGARNFMGYCAGCHSLKYARYSRIAKDIGISEAEATKSLVLPGSKINEYVSAPMAPEDAETWFGKLPPDLSLMARARDHDYIYHFLKGFYADPSRPTGVNNLLLNATAMPHVLSALQGVPEAVFCSLEKKGEGAAEKVVQKLQLGVAGQLNAEQYDQFARDTANFLEYIGEPGKAKRMSQGVWIMLFLLAFTFLAYLLKREYWKDVK